MNECINCTKKTNSLDNWKTCEFECSYKYEQLKMYKSYQLEEQIKELKQEHEHEMNNLFAEKINLNKIIDRLLESAGFSKDVANEEEFEEVYNTIQFKNNKYKQYRQVLEEIREIAVKKNYLSLDEALDDIANKANEVLDE